MRNGGSNEKVALGKARTSAGIKKYLVPVPLHFSPNFYLQLGPAATSTGSRYGIMNGN